MPTLNLFELYAKVSLDTGDYEKGLDQASKKSSGFASTLKKGLATAAKVGAAAIGAAATGIAALTKASIDQYAEYEQLVGGVDTLFGTAASKVKEYAEQAFQSAGMSANEYMTTVTSFSASLLQSLGGDTEKAAQKADQAIRDMSDNANKMGTSMEMIQNAYQGFAKQNYTMLDNLKLGYGGTQKEMQRLLEDAEKLSGIKYDISSYADIVDAIHVVQTEMGITGTTAKEASSTISGSVGMMKAAWSNFLTGLADETADHGKLMDDLVASVETVGHNIIPVIQRLIPAIAEGIGQLAIAISERVPEILETAMSSIPALVGAAGVVIKNLLDALMSALPVLAEAGFQMLVEITVGLLNAIPELIDSAAKLLEDFLGYLSKNGPSIIEAGKKILISLTNGVINGITHLLQNLPQIITAFVGFITDNLPSIIDAGIEILLNLVTGIINAIPDLVEAIPQIIDALTRGIESLMYKVVDVGKNIVNSIKDGIASAWDGLKSWFNGIWNSLFGGRSVNVHVNKTQSGARVDGSHAGGLRSVPFDGYIAELHKGERVLTREEASRYRDGEGRMGTVNITVNAAPGQSETVIAQKVARILENERERRAAAFG